MAKSLREELEKRRANLSEQEMNQLECEQNELSDIIIDSYMSEKKNTIQSNDPQ